MKKSILELLIKAAVLGFSISSFAGSNLCDLDSHPIPNESSFDPQKVSEYRTRIKNECELYKQYQALKKTAQNKWSISLSQVSVYEAMRYIERYRYDEAKQKEIPVRLIYQRLKTDYEKSNEDKSSEIWDNWQIGIKQLDLVREEIQNGQPISLARLLKVHRGFYALSEETGDFAQSPSPGEMRRPYDNDNPWWSIDDADVEAVTSQAKEMNATYESFQLLSHLDDSSDAYINQIISVRPLGAGYSMYAGDTRANLDHLKTILNFTNQMLAQSMRGEHMQWNGQLVSPAELAYLVQQYYVGVHAFLEGNGRTSRFLQELILTSFDLPHGSSGDLMDKDVLTKTRVYYEFAMAKNFELLGQVKDCFDRVYRGRTLFTSKKIYQIDQSSLEYQCRLFPRE